MRAPTASAFGSALRGRLRVALAAGRLVFASLAFAGAALAQAQPQPPPEPPRAAPGQRLEQLQRMSPAERRETWRRMSPDERAAVREQIPPERRDELRQRWFDARDRVPERTPGDSLLPGDGPRRLSPEERQRLRDQINETNRDLRWKGARRQEFQRKSR
jgi:hypothetical protein